MDWFPSAAILISVSWVVCNNRHLLTQFQGLEDQIKVQAWSCFSASSEGQSFLIYSQLWVATVNPQSFLTCRCIIQPKLVSVVTWSSLYVFVSFSSSDKDTNHIGLWLTLTESSTQVSLLDYICNNSISTQFSFRRTGVRTSTYHFWGRNSTHNNVSC